MRRMSRQIFMVIVLLMSVLPAIPPATYATSSIPKLCFAQTGQCIDEPFQSYWQQNGGLPVFGYPITAPREELNRDTGQRYLTQWFERARFEYHPKNRAPYHVLLGRLGDDQLVKQGINASSAPREAGPKPGCLWFAVTGYNVCDQAAGIGFKRYWLSQGLLDPQLDAYQRSLALFGYPLTEPRVVTNASGDRVLTQWFERARFEYHPNKPPQFKVLLGLMGTELYGKFAPPTPCRTDLAISPVNVGRTPSFCIAWVDRFADEQRFLIVLKYLPGGEELRYITPPNTTQLYVPVSDNLIDPPDPRCAQRRGFSIEVVAIRPTAASSVGSMAGDGACDG